MNELFLSLLPPLVVALTVFVFRQTLVAVFLGFCTAALVAANFSFTKAFGLMPVKLGQTLQLANLTNYSSFWQSDKLFLLAFLLVLSMLISLISLSGVVQSYVAFVDRRINNARQAQFSTLILSLFMFIDDYLNAMTVSKIAPAITDKYKVARLKISFLVASLAAPLCTLTPISSWGAAIISLISSSGVDNAPGKLINADSFFTFSMSIPFVFFSWLSIFAAFVIVYRKISFGKMAVHEEYALEAGSLLGPKANYEVGQSKLKNDISPGGLVFFFLPISSLIYGVFFFVLLLGGWSWFGGDLGFIAALKNAPSELALLTASLCSFVLSSIVFWFFGKINLAQNWQAVKDGFCDIKDILLLLILAWSMGSFLTDDLQVGHKLAQALFPFLNIKFLPASIFLISSLIAFLLGSSWATMFLLFPMIIPLIANYLHLNPGSSLLVLYVSIGAILSGVVFGSSLSPTADLILMITRRTQSNLNDFLQSQLAYLLPIGIVTFLIFLVLGFVLHLPYLCIWGIGFGIGLLFLVLLRL